MQYSSAIESVQVLVPFLQPIFFTLLAPSQLKRVMEELELDLLVRVLAVFEV